MILSTLSTILSCYYFTYVALLLFSPSSQNLHTVLEICHLSGKTLSSIMTYIFIKPIIILSQIPHLSQILPPPIVVTSSRVFHHRYFNSKMSFHRSCTSTPTLLNSNHYLLIQFLLLYPINWIFLQIVTNLIFFLYEIGIM